MIPINAKPLTNQIQIHKSSSRRTADMSCTCVVTAPAEVAFTFECQLAAFGGYLPHSEGGAEQANETPKVVTLAQDASMLACSKPAEPSQDPEQHNAVDRYQDAIVLVRRGECAFQDKLVQVVGGGAYAMILVNSKDTLLHLGSLTYDDALNGAFAVSVKKSDGEKLLQLIQEHQQSQESREVKLSISSSVPRMRQALQRIQYLLYPNFPLIAYETFMDEIPSEMRDSDALMANLDAADPKKTSQSTNEGVGSPPPTTTDREWIEFFHQCALAFTSQWEFTSTISFHAAVAAVSLLTSTETDTKFAELWQMTAHKLAEAGYYAQSAFCLQQIQGVSPGFDAIVQCQLAFVNFLQGDIVNSIPTAKQCLGESSSSGSTESIGVNISARNLHVAHENLVRLARLDMSSDDLHCLRQAAGISIGEQQQPHHHQPGFKCCQNRVLPSRDDVSRPSRSQRHRQQFDFHSAFVEELFHSLNILGVFLDELGAFNESLRFFKYADQLCPDDIPLQLRQVLAVPVVFSSTAEIGDFYTQLQAKIKALAAKPRTKEFVLSSVPENTYAEPYHTMWPEDATYLQYTITPPTMFIGYQGVDVLPIQRAIYDLRKVIYPSLQSEPLLQFPISATPEDPGSSSQGSPAASQPPARRRIAFVSTWFRNHSVGKLLLGIVKRLDRTKFHVLLFRCVHFLRDSDDLTDQFRAIADTFVDLPVNQEDALALLKLEQIDVLVFPELGMDAWTLLLSYHRVAPVQCVFWGHPITTGNPAIDYFISSEYFFSDFFTQEQDEDNVNTDREDLMELKYYHGSSFSEQVVLFRGLSTFFTRPSLVKFDARLTRSMLHLPENRRLYVCPQTLMKLHPDFDNVLAGILHRDPHGYIVLLASETQEVWKEQLRKRFRRSLGLKNTRRVLFVSTLPYAEFMALLSFADVILDPFPFGGGVTTLDALALGIPVVTLPAAQTVVQLAAGFLRYMNVTSTIAKSVEQFVNISIAIATNADNVRDDLHEQLLAKQNVVYDDEASVDDWNSFLAHVTDK